MFVPHLAAFKYIGDNVGYGGNFTVARRGLLNLGFRNRVPEFLYVFRSIFRHPKAAVFQEGQVALQTAEVVPEHLFSVQFCGVEAEENLLDFEP